MKYFHNQIYPAPLGVKLCSTFPLFTRNIVSNSKQQKGLLCHNWAKAVFIPAVQQLCPRASAPWQQRDV